MKTYRKTALPIKSWAEADRPREKLILKGRQYLSEAELLAILLGSGNREESALGLAQRILNSMQNNLNELGKCSLEELQAFKGIGTAKAVTIAAALELGRRRQLSSIQDRPQVKSSQDAYNAIGPTLSDLEHEEFWILLLNRANRVIGREQISIGGMTGTVVDSKILFNKALVGRACAIILCHNHPSGNIKPSQADLDLTKKLKQAGVTLDIMVLDHLIIGNSNYFSFADESLL